MVEYSIEGLSSLKTLHLGANSAEFHFSIRNLPSLIKLSFHSYSPFTTIDENFVKRLLDQVPHIQELFLEGKLSYFNLDSLVNLKQLSLHGFKLENFNFELFKNLCNQLESLKIGISEIDQEDFFKLFVGYNFPFLQELTLIFQNVKRLTKEFLNRLPKPKKLSLYECEIEVIESDSFSNMQQLTSLDLRQNQIEIIKKNAFSNLKNLKTLNLRDNIMRKCNRKFVGLEKSVEVNI